MENVKVKGFRGRWHSIDEKVYFGEILYLMEHDFYGDETACIIIDKNANLIYDDVWNGFDDLDEEFSWFDYVNEQVAKGVKNFIAYPKNYVEFLRNSNMGD